MTTPKIQTVRAKLGARDVEISVWPEDGGTTLIFAVYTGSATIHANLTPDVAQSLILAVQMGLDRLAIKETDHALA